MTHYNIQINIQIVDEARAPAATRQYGSHSPAPEPKGERRVTEVAAVKVTAATEAEAFAKAHRMLAAATPEVAASVEQTLADPVDQRPR